MDTIKFLKKGIKHNGKYIPVWYSGGELIGHPKKTITIYAKEYGHNFPNILNPKNESDMMTDYFDKDKARIEPKNKFYKKVSKFVRF